MRQKHKRKPITDTGLKNIVENFHLGFAVAPAVAVTLATIFGKDIHLYIELIFIILVIIVNFCILWLRSKTAESKELSLFNTFRTNNLLPAQTGDDQRYHVEIAVIEDTDSSFRESLQDRFKKDLSIEMLKNLISKLPKYKNRVLTDLEMKSLVLEETTDRHLFFNLIKVKPPKK